MATADLTPARLRDLLHYDPDTGAVTWKVRRRPRFRAGDRAGSNWSDSNGKHYRQIMIAGRTFKEHRVAWALHHGEWPAADLEIDHTNGNGLDNRISNLRLVSQSVNQQNKRRANGNNKTGLLGVSQRRTNFQARILINGRSLHLGVFVTAELAHAAYIEAKRELHEGSTI